MFPGLTPWVWHTASKVTNLDVNSAAHAHVADSVGLQTAGGTIYYVNANTGSDSNSGTSPMAAWATVNKVNTSTFSAGDRILFARGQIHRTPENGLKPPSSGSSGSPITFGSYDSGDGTDDPKIYGSADGTGMTWTQSGNIWKSEAVNYNSDLAKRANRIYDDDNPSPGFANQGGYIPKGIELDSLWGNSWTKDTSSRYYTTLQNPKNHNWTHLIVNADLKGGPESSRSAVNAEFEWYYDSGARRLYVGTPSDNSPASLYSSVVVVELNSNNDWCYAHNGSSGRYFLYRSGGSPSTQYSVLELPNCKLTAYISGKNYVNFENLEFRYGAEGLWIEDNSSNCIITDCNIRQVCRNGLQIDGDSNTWTTSGGGRTSAIEKCGTEWHKRPQTASVSRNGHVYHLTGGNNNLVENVILQDADGEDGCQHADNPIGANNTLKNVLIRECREDGIDVKGGTINLEDSEVYAEGDGSGRNGILLHDQSTGCNVTDSLIWTGPQSGDCITRNANVDITITRSTLDVTSGTAYCVDCKQNTGDVTSKASVYLPNTSRSAIRIVNGFFDSRHDSFYLPSGTPNDALIELRGSNKNNIMYNCAVHAVNHRLVDIDNGSNLDADNCCFYRGNSSNDWVNDNGTTVDESDIDSNYSNAGVVFANCKTVIPGFADPANDDLTITSSDAAASGGRTGAGVTSDRLGSAYDTVDPEIGAYAVGGVPTVELAGALHLITSGNVTLDEIVTSVSVAVAEALHTHGVETVGLTVLHDLGAADSTHVHAAQNVHILGQPSQNLRLADSAHAHISDGVDIDAVISVHHLAPDDATHAHAGDAVSIGVNIFVHDVGLTDAVHALASEGVEVSEFSVVLRGKISIPAERRSVSIAAENRMYKVAL